MTFLIAAAAAVVVYMIFERFLRIAATIVLLAGVLTYLLQPVVEWLVQYGKERYRHTLRIGVVLLLYVALAGLLYTFGAAITRPFVKDFGALQETWSTASQHLPQQLSGLRAWYEQMVPGDFRKQIADAIQNEIDQFPGKYVPQFMAVTSGIAKRIWGWIAL
ncbi:MAG TPA: AI-2E family transporter, partial [Armatimonadota bacterium]